MYSRTVRYSRGFGASFLFGLFLFGQLALSTSTAAAASGTIPLSVRCVGSSQSSAPVFTGIPFPMGHLTDPNLIDLVSGGSSVPRQVTVTSTYPDGSVRVALVGFRVTLAAGSTLSAEIRYGSAPGIPLSPEMAWTRNLNILALCPPRWYGESSVFNLRFLASADNTFFPAFESEMRYEYDRQCDPASNTNPDTRNYYDHAHAMYMALLRDGNLANAPVNIWTEVRQYRENEILHSGTYRGQYSAGSYTNNSQPIPFANVRRMFPQGLLEDYYLTGDARSLEVAREIGEAYLIDAYQQGVRFTWTERIPGWELMGLGSLYEATLDSRYLDAARYVADIAMDHQDAMAVKYPNQGFISGQTGGFIQDRNGAWYDPSESTASGAGSPFMTSLLCEGLIRVYWLTGDARVRQSILNACDWLADAGYTSSTRSFWYVCRASDNSDSTPSLNPMWFQMLGFAHQATGDPKYRTIAASIAGVNDWGNHIKEFNQGMHCSGQGLYLLQNAAGTVPLTLGTGSAPPPSAPSISSLTPSSAQAGGAGFTLTVSGSGFASGATVKWNGGARTTTVDSGTQVRAAIPASDIAAAGTAQVTVANPGTSDSNSLTFTITSPQPTPVQLSSLTLNPTSVVGGQSSSGVITLSAAAPSGGVTAALTSSSEFATTPTHVTVPAGATSATFTVGTIRSKRNRSATISATADGVTVSAVLRITRR